MKVMTYTLFVSAMVTMTGCTSSGNLIGNSQKVNFVGNPASTYCVNEGGYITLDKDENGHNKIGMCHTENGEVIEQWEYYRNAVQEEKASSI